MTIKDPLDNNSIDFKALLLKSIETCFRLILKNQHKQAEEMCTDSIIKYGAVFKNIIFDVVGSDYQQIYTSLILLKGLQEYNQLLQINENVSWQQDCSTIEFVWLKLCDCRERIEYSSQCLKSQFLEDIIQYLDNLESFFPDAFEDGSYLSPGIVVDKYLCSICGEDTRACFHLGGRLYSGKICAYKPINPQTNQGYFILERKV
jgi:hypothetical protein